MKTSKIFFGLVLLLILLFAGAITYSLYQTLPKKKELPPVPTQTSKVSQTLKTGTPSAIPSIKPAETQTPNPNSKVLKPAQIQITTSIIIESTNSGKIKGTLTVENKSDQDWSDLYFDLYLRAPETLSATNQKGQKMAIISQGMPVSFAESKSFTLNAGEKKSLPLEISFSANISPGRFTLQTAIISKESRKLAGTATDLTLSGKSRFLELIPGSCRVFVGDKEFAPNIGPNIDPGQTPLGRCKFKNPTSQPLTLHSSVDYAVRHVMNYPVSEKIHNEGKEIISFAPSETKTISVALPALSVPQVYEAYTRLVDEQNQSVSPVISFRWIVRGPSAHIQEVTPDKNIYSQGETANISILISPSLDLYWRSPLTEGSSPNEGTTLTNAQLAVKLTNDQGNLCGTAQQALPPAKQSGDWDAQNIPVKITSYCPSPKVEVKILYNDQTLAQFARQIKTPAKTQKPTITKGQTQSLTMTLIFLGLGILAIVILVVIKNRKSSPKIPGTMILIILATTAALGGILILAQLQNSSQVFAQCTDPSTCTIFSPPTQPPPSNILWRKLSGTNQNGSNEQSVFGDWWQSGSYIRQVSSSSIEVHFEGNTWNQTCDNFRMGFLLTNLINGSGSDLSITPGSFTSSGGVGPGYNSASGNTVLLTQPPDFFDIPYSGPISITYTITKTNGNLPGSYQLTLNTEFLLIKTQAFDGMPWDLYSSANMVYHTDGSAAGVSTNEPLSSWASIDNRSWCGGGTIPGCMGQVQVSGNMSASCDPPGTQATLTWSIPGAVSSDLRADDTSNGWNGSCSSPNSGDLCVNGASSPYSFTTVAGNTYDWWVGAWDSSGGNHSITGPSFTCNTTPPTPTPVPTATPVPGSPIISSLTIGNVAPNPSFSPGPSPARISGLQTSEGGSGWYNPMSIRLDVTPGTNQNSNYYVAFYDKTSGQLTNKTTFLTDAKSKITNPKNGFLLKYDRSLNKHYIWDQNGWSQLPITVSDSSNNPLILANAVNGGTDFASWKITFYKQFGSKDMFTAAYVEDSSATPLADFDDNCTKPDTHCNLLTP